MYGIGECLFKQYTDKWEMCSVQGHSKRELKELHNSLHKTYCQKFQNGDKNVMKMPESDENIMK